VPRVSIITATYNRSEVLRFAIESVRNQTYSDYELLIVGDACTDDTAAVVASFGDPRIRFTNLPDNFGEQSGPNNAGFRAATGDLIAYLNHDDLWLPDHLASLVGFIDAQQADIVYALPFSIDRHGLAFCGVTNAELRYDPSHFVPASLWLLRRTVVTELGGWRSSRETDARNPSQDLLFRAWKHGKDMRCHPRLTAIILASGGRPGAYVSHEDQQHRELTARLREPGFREDLAIAAAVTSARELSRLRSLRWNSLPATIFDRVVVKLGGHPDSVRNRLMRRRRGWWIDYLRELRGLAPLDDWKKSK